MEYSLRTQGTDGSKDDFVLFMFLFLSERVKRAHALIRLQVEKRTFKERMSLISLNGVIFA
jgi:hypothetical protein